MLSTFSIVFQIDLRDYRYLAACRCWLSAVGYTLSKATCKLYVCMVDHPKLTRNNPKSHPPPTSIFLERNSTAASTPVFGATAGGAGKRPYLALG